MNSKVIKSSIASIFVFAIMLLSCAKSVTPEMNGVWISNDNQIVIVILDSILLENSNLFTHMLIKKRDFDTVYLEDKSGNSDQNLIEEFLVLNNNKSLSIISNNDTLLLKKMKLLESHNNIKEVSIEIYNKSFGFDIFTVKVNSNKELFVNEKKTKIIKESLFIIDKININNVGLVFEDDDFMPGTPIIYMNILLNDGLNIKLRFLGWREAPVELQSLIMNLILLSILSSQ